MAYRLVTPVQQPPSATPGKFRLVSPPDTPSMIGDIARGAMSGVARGITGFAGLKGDLDSLVGRGLAAAERGLGFGDGEPTPTHTPLGATSAETTGFVQENLTGPFYQPKTTGGKIAETIGEFAPGALAGPGGMARRFITQAAIPGAASELAGEAAQGTAAEPYARVLGALTGAAAPGLAARAITPLPISPERQAMVNALTREGVTSPTAGQRTGRQRLQYFESEMGGAGTARALDQSGTEFTSAALRRIGETADRATPEVIQRAGQRIGGEFDRLAANTSVPLDQQLQNDMLQVTSDYQSVAGTVAPVVEDMMNRVAEVARQNGGIIQGRAYQNIRSDFGGFIKKSTGETQQALRDMQEALDDAVERHMPPGQLEEWRAARRQYRNLLVIERAATGAGEQAAMGIISPAKLRQAAVGQNRRAYVRGIDDFSELTHAGQAIMTPLPNSGTPGRLRAQGVSNAVSTAVGGLLGHQLTGDVGGAVAGSVLGGVAPTAVGWTAMSRPAQRYLANQVLAGPARGIRPSVGRAALLQAIMSPRRLSPQQQ